MEDMPEMVNLLKNDMEQAADNRFSDDHVITRTRESLIRWQCMEMEDAFDMDGKQVRPTLHDWEVSQLMNLVPEDAETAVNLIPSLGRFNSDRVIHEILSLLPEY
eukprot:TRINITY_DN1679_c0_g1_i2.p1 TRINITY_DN1679_c0_g1~~TRINITY_DN1679_c0_g1_i2.p1  ORF type:complete len:105 (-),score=18.95 TRINITY_DN1679_c0_g1_i2:75-389(-)